MILVFHVKIPVSVPPGVIFFPSYKSVYIQITDGRSVGMMQELLANIEKNKMLLHIYKRLHSVCVCIGCPFRCVYKTSPAQRGFVNLCSCYTSCLEAGEVVI